MYKKKKKKAVVDKITADAVVQQVEERGDLAFEWKCVSLNLFILFRVNHVTEKNRFSLHTL